jgi:hypothetical protein
MVLFALPAAIVMVIEPYLPSSLPVLIVAPLAVSLTALLLSGNDHMCSWVDFPPAAVRFIITPRLYLPADFASVKDSW